MTGYCSVEDVERVLQEADITARLDTSTVVDAITAQTEWVEMNTRRHWFVEGGAEDDSEDVVFTSGKSRDDEHDIRTTGASVIGSADDRVNTIPPSLPGGRDRGRRPDPRIKIEFGNRHDEDIPTYTRIRLERKDVTALNALYVADEDGQYVDWTEEAEGGVGNDHRGEDWWVRINNRGVAELYLDIHTMDEFGMPPSFSNAVYVDIDYGLNELPQGVRRGVALLAAAQLVQDDELNVSMPDQGQLVNVETKSEAYERWAIAENSHLEPHLESSW